jgi:hypothetical protein
VAGEVAARCLDQLERSLQPDGRLVLRLDAIGEPMGGATSDDAQARALWGSALASVSDLPPLVCRRAAALFTELASFRTSHPRAAAHAVVAAAAALRRHPRWAPARRLLAGNWTAVPRAGVGDGWPWPEARLSYGNGLLVEALLDLADLEGDGAAAGAALRLLDWLVAHERRHGHFSFTPVGGRGPDDPAGFDQQPIEAWALAEAVHRAHAMTGLQAWVEVAEDLVAWFDGANDVGVSMWDPRTGAAYDGLTSEGVNANQGTESTLALIGTRWARWAVGQDEAVSRRSWSR